MSLPPRDGRDLARVLLDRADDDITLVRHVVDDAEIADDEPALDRQATLALIEEIRAWAGISVGA